MAVANKIEYVATDKQWQTIYSHTFFPEMKADWRTYPDNIGHFHSDGCFRCHDIIAQGTGQALAEISPQGLAFKQPEDIGGMWQDCSCSFCHDGGLVEWKARRRQQ